HAQAAPDLNPALFQRGPLLDQRRRIHNDTIADDAGLSGMQDAGRNKVENKPLLADDNRMTGIMAALEADDQIGRLGQKVHNLPLALVSPLGSNNDDVGHYASR